MNAPLTVHCRCGAVMAPAEIIAYRGVCEDCFSMGPSAADWQPCGTPLSPEEEARFELLPEEEEVTAMSEASLPSPVTPQPAVSPLPNSKTNLHFERFERLKELSRSLGEHATSKQILAAAVDRPEIGTVSISAAKRARKAVWGASDRPETKPFVNTSAIAFVAEALPSLPPGGDRLAQLCELKVLCDRFGIERVRHLLKCLEMLEE